MRQKPSIRLPKLYSAGGDLSKRWFVYYHVRNPKSGKMERFRDYTGLLPRLTASQRHAVAKKIIQEITNKLRSGWTPFNENTTYPNNLQFQTALKEYRKAVAPDSTFAFYASKFLDNLTNSHEPATICTYRSKLRMFNCWLEGLGLDKSDASSFDVHLLTDFFNFIIRERKLSKNSVKKYNQILFNTFKLIGQKNKRFVNPVKEMPTTSRLNENAPLPIRQDHISKITEVMKERDPQLLLAAKFLFYCCLRPGNELRFLKINDMDLLRGIIKISALHAKTKISRIVTIPQQFLDELREMNLDRLPSSYFVLGINRASGPIHLGKNSLRQRWAEIRKEMNLPDLYKFYSWKHTGNVLAVDAGIPFHQIQLQNGHTSIRTTEIYIRNKVGDINQDVRTKWPTM